MVTIETALVVRSNASHVCVWVYTVCVRCLVRAPDTSQPVAQSPARVKAAEEKFLKLREVYTNLRTEHISLLRKEGEGRKKLSVRIVCFLCVMV